MLRPVTSLLALLAIVPVLAGCIDGGDERLDTEDPAPQEPEFVPRVVVAVVDTGVPPYHAEFRQVRVGEDPFAHPSTYIEGYPAEVPAVNITLSMPGDAANDAEAYLKADGDLWNGTTMDQLYWVPGTKFIGMIGIGDTLPGGGHGTMTSGRAGGNTISIAGEDVLLVHVRAPLALQIGLGEDAQSRATKWAADQPWIDIQSHSWGWPAMCAGAVTTHTWGWAEAFKYARDKQLVFVATGNGHGNGLATGYPSQCQDNSGVAGVVPVGGTDNDGYARWANWFPAVAADACDNPAPNQASIDEIENTGGGTSSATPFTAGGAAKLILEARRIFHDPTTGIKDGVVATLHEGGAAPASGPLADGEFTMEELKQVLFRTALNPPTSDDSDGEACMGTQIPIPGQAPPESTYAFYGYGEVNGASIEHAIEVLNGTADLPERAIEDQIYTNDQAARRAMWG